MVQKSRWKSPGGAQLSVDQMLRVCKRFYVALILSKLVQVSGNPYAFDALIWLYFSLASGLIHILHEIEWKGIPCSPYLHVLSKCANRTSMNVSHCPFCSFYEAVLISNAGKLFQLQEVSLLEVCEMFKVPKGKVQGLQESAGRFASMIAAFCERLGWSDMECLVTKFQKRVLFGVKAEIVDLTEIPFVKVSPPVPC